MLVPIYLSACQQFLLKKKMLTKISKTHFRAQIIPKKDLLENAQLQEIKKKGHNEVLLGVFVEEKSSKEANSEQLERANQYIHLDSGATI